MTTLNKLAERDYREAANRTHHPEPKPSDELLILAGLFWGLAGLLLLAWMWGWA